MVTLSKLAEIREETRKKIYMRKIGENSIKVTVGMATCGIAAGARPVLLALADSIYGGNIQNVILTQTGCKGNCELEPVVEVSAPGKEKVTYVHMTPEKARRVVSEHIINGNVVTEYTLDAAAK